MAHLLVIGGASSDILHFGGQKVSSLGGAGMYTAMAAQRSGVQVTMFSPRPDPLPDQFIPVNQRLAGWLGPRCSPAELPQFEISYERGKTEYLQEYIGAEEQLSPTHIPGDLAKYDLIHVTPLGDAERQLTFLLALRKNGAKRISAGTGLFNAEQQPEAIRIVFEHSDYAFMNYQEAEMVYGSLEAAKSKPGKVHFITRGEEGAIVVQGDYVTNLPAVPSQVLDPTGAGDTFCGAAVAQLILGNHPVMAATAAAVLSAEMIQYPGPTALFSPDPPPAVPVDLRALVNDSQVWSIARLVAELPQVEPFDFTGPELPAVGDPLTLDWFFVATLQQFGFWTTDKGRYHQPVIATIDGKKLKGSDYLWQAYLRQLHNDPAFFSVERQANLSPAEMEQLFQADDGSIPMPALDLHLAQARQYADDMLALNLSPKKLLQQASDSSAPLKTFFEILDHIGGYKEDPLRKKPGLLAFILNQRPENFLVLGEHEEVTPVIDYHVMRTCLRTGLVEILDDDLMHKLVSRQVLLPEEEQVVRFACYQAVDRVASRSGRSMGAVDWFFFNSRKRCPEMTDPDCQRCPVDPLCAHHKDLFQPVIRTVFY